MEMESPAARRTPATKPSNNPTNNSSKAIISNMLQLGTATTGAVEELIKMLDVPGTVVSEARRLAGALGASVTSVVVGPGGDVTVRLGGGPAGIWELQSSSNLVNWVKIADLTNTTGRVEYNAPAPANNKFFRAVLP